MLDLHIHSTASDGTLTPARIVAKAEDIQLTAIALTDHDTTAGLDEFMTAGNTSSVTTIPGVEVATSWYGASLHIVGLFIRPHFQPLEDMLYKIRGNRDLRNRKLLRKLNDKGVPLTYEDIEYHACEDVVGRPHFAAALIEHGFCTNHREAFAKYLGKNSATYVSRYLPLPDEAIKMIKAAGGIAIWAHPLGGQPIVRPARIRQIARHLKKFGLTGMEVFYSEYDREKENTAKQIADELGLKWSGGSDFHGANMPGFDLGTGRGDLSVPDDILNCLTGEM